MMFKSWESVYGDKVISGENIHSKKTVTYQLKKTTESNFWIYDCLFNECNSDTRGGAIYDSASQNLLIEATSFISCHTGDGNSGAIYRKPNKGESVMNKICGYDCYSIAKNGVAYYQFCQIYVEDKENVRNIMSECSVTNCKQNMDKVQNTLSLENGNVQFLNSNSSYNALLRNSFGYLTPTPSNSITCNASYSCFVNHTSSKTSCLLIGTQSGSFLMSFCNVLNNQCGESENGVIYSYGNLLILSSTILGNNNNSFVFHARAEADIITIKECTIDSRGSNGEGKVIFDKQAKTSFINALSMFSTEKCPASFDTYGSLTPFTPRKETITKKLRHLFYNKIIFVSMLPIIMIFISF